MARTQPDMRKKSSRDLLEKIKKRYRLMYDADQENRELAMDDLKFTNQPGYQWDANMKQERGLRPCYEFNKIRPLAKRVINDMRANRPQGKVRAVEGGDVDGAEIREGLARNIWNISDAESVIDYAAEYQVIAGFGAWRVVTDYSDDDMFDQDILIEPIPNPFCLYCDPAARDPLKRDAEDWIVTEKITESAFEERYGEKGKVDFEGTDQFDDDPDWNDDDRVRIVEYWYKKPHTKALWQLQDGTVIDSDSDEAATINPAEILRERKVLTHKICSVIASGDRILEGPTEWAGSMFPFVMVYGEYVYIDGQPKWWGLPRFARDAQQSYNFARTAIAEAIALAPKSQIWATAEQAKGLESQWNVAHKKNFPFQIYNPDDKAPGPPQRVGGPDIPVALIQETQIASDELKAVTGIFDASMGARSNESSGRAIYARQQQGEIVTFNYMDNMAKGIKRTYEIILDLIPHIYDAERELRVLGSDGKENYVRINEVRFDPGSGKNLRLNDMSAGKYDVTVTVGPSFATLRQEAAEVWSNLGQQYPEIWSVAGDLIMKSMDLPYADDIAERLQTLLPPPIQQLLGEGKDVPPEVQQMMQQAQEAMQQVQEHGQLVEAASRELEEQKATNAKDKAEIRALQADLKTARAEFEAEIAEKLARIVEKDASVTMKEAQWKETVAEQSMGEAEQQVSRAESFQAVMSEIDETLARFMEAVKPILDDLESKSEKLRERQDRKIVDSTTERRDGKLYTVVKYSDGTSRSFEGRRENGQLRLVEPDSEAGSEA